MLDWKRVLQLRVFSEEEDVFTGPKWAFSLFLMAAVVGYGSGGLMLFALVDDATTFAIQAYAIFIAAFAIMCGIAWHFGMRGKAKNGLLLAVIIAAVVAVVA